MSSMVEWKKLGDIANCYAGATPSTKVASYWENGMIPWMSSGEVHQGIVTHTASYITQLGYDNSSTKMLPKGTIVIALAGQGKTRGCVAITDIELCTNQSLCGIVLYNSDIINKYVYYFLRTRYNHLRKISSGEGTRGGLNLKMISEYEIPIPSLSEQQRIVERLDTFTSSIENLKEQIAQRRKQYECYRDQLLDLEGKEGVEMKKLGDACEIRRGIRVVKKQLKEDDLYPVFQNSIAPMGFYDQFNRDGDMPYIICAGSSSGSVGYCYTPFWAADDCFTIESSKVSRRYTYYALKKYNNNLFKLVRKGSMPRLPHEAIDNMVIPIPSLSEQQHIVSILDTFEASIRNLEQQLVQREKQYEYYRNKLLTFE